MSSRRRKIERRLAARVAGFNGLSPNDNSRLYENDVTKPGSKNAKKVS